MGKFSCFKSLVSVAKGDFPLLCWDKKSGPVDCIYIVGRSIFSSRTAMRCPMMARSSKKRIENYHLGGLIFIVFEG